jgi:hypothetical protein
MGLYNKLIEQSWMDTPAPGIKKKPVAVPDAPVATPKASAMDISKLAPAKTGAMDMSKLAGSASKGMGKAAAKSAGKFVPGLGAAIGLADMGARYNQGDYTGAGIAGLSTVASQIPGLGWGAAAGLDIYNLYRDQQAEAEAEKKAAHSTTSAKPLDKTEPAATPAIVTPTATPAEPIPTATPAAPTATPAAPTHATKGTAAKSKKTSSPQHSAKEFNLKNFQSHLNSLGANIAVDGRPGPATDAAVRTYLLHQK